MRKLHECLTKLYLSQIHELKLIVEFNTIKFQYISLEILEKKFKKTLIKVLNFSFEFKFEFNFD